MPPAAMDAGVATRLRVRIHLRARTIVGIMRTNPFRGVGHHVFLGGLCVECLLHQPDSIQ